MALNCKPGDLARVVSAIYTPEMVDRYVYVLCAATEPAYHGFTCVYGGGHNWLCEAANGELLPWRDGAGNLDMVPSRPIPDMRLRPIRPQRNDAVDEMVAKLGPAPMTLTEVMQGVVHG